MCHRRLLAYAIGWVSIEQWAEYNFEVNYVGASAGSDAPKAQIVTNKHGSVRWSECISESRCEAEERFVKHYCHWRGKQVVKCKSQNMENLAPISVAKRRKASQSTADPYPQSRSFISLSFIVAIMNPNNVV